MNRIPFVSLAEFHPIKICFLFSLLALAGAYTLEYLWGIAPCPLCMIQRIAMGGILVLALITILHKPRSLGIRFYSLGILIFSTLGGIVAYHHASLYHLPQESLSSCGSTLSYLFENFSWREAFSALWKGGKSCTQDTFQLLFLNIPEWALLFFAACFVLSAISLMKGGAKSG